MKNSSTELFENRPVRQAVVALVVPTIISQLITVIYNMADTVFIGQMGDSNQVAAATLAMPVFVMLTGIANLFGIGGSSLISRSLGEGNREKAKHCAAFSIWTAVVLAFLYGLVLLVFRPVILPAIGTDDSTYALCYRYTFWTITVGAVPTVLNAELAHLIRSEGHSRQASIGMAFGGILNIALDPVFIFLFRLEIAGAAIATMLSNLAATIYFLILICLRRERSVITLNPRYYTWKEGILKEILLVGLPSALMSFMGIVSNVVLNRLVSAYSSEAVAGMGIAKKIDLLAFAIATGMSQGVLPLIGYTYAAKNYERMRNVIRTTFLYSMLIAGIGTVFLFTCAVHVSRFFINDEATVTYGQHFLRVICTTCPCVSVTTMMITLFQATGSKIQPMVLSLLRKGCLDVPFMFLMNHLVGVNGIAWAVPIADTLAMATSICLFIPFWRRLYEKTAE